MGISERWVVAAVATVLCGCTPVAYGVKACTEASGLNHGTQMAYQAPGVGTPVCMPPQATIYITCIRELSRSEPNASIPSPDLATKAPGQAPTDPTRQADLRVEYVDEAHVRAVEYCAKAAGLSK